MSKPPKSAGACFGKRDQPSHPLRQRKVRVTQGMDDRVLAVMKHSGMADLAEAYRHVIHRGLHAMEAQMQPACEGG